MSLSPTEIVYYTHIAGGTTAGLFAGKSFEDAFNDSFEGLFQSMAIGGAVGVASTIAVSYANGINPWTGEPIATAKDLGIQQDVDRIKEGIEYPHKNDGHIFNNREGILPKQLYNKYYREYVVPTPGINGACPQRIVVGRFGEWYYTPDHYKTFINFKPYVRQLCSFSRITRYARSMIMSN